MSIFIPPLFDLDQVDVLAGEPDVSPVKDERGTRSVSTPLVIVKSVSRTTSVLRGHTESVVTAVIAAGVTGTWNRHARVYTVPTAVADKVVAELLEAGVHVERRARLW